MRVVALSAGVRAPSSTRALADALVRAVVEHLALRGEAASTRTVEVRDHALDATFALLDGVRSSALADALGAVGDADVLVVATPVYNGSYSGLFKTFTDLLAMDDLVGTPVVLGATGGSARHTLAVDQELRPLFTVLQATTVPTGVYAARDDWRAPGEPDAALAERIDRAGWEAAALARARADGGR
jgi:FMN reductase